MLDTRDPRLINPTNIAKLDRKYTTSSKTELPLHSHNWFELLPDIYFEVAVVYFKNDAI